MSVEQMKGFVLVAGIICISGASAAQGYVYAANVWQKGRLIWRELAKSGTGFGGSVVAYWFALKYLTEFGALSAELQVLICFSVTIIGVALVSGRFFKWPALDQIIAMVVLAGIVWLMIRNVG